MPNLKAIQLHVCKIQGKNNENWRLFEGSYLGNGWPDLLQIWYIVYPDVPAPAQQIWSCLTGDHRAANKCKIIFVIINSHCAPVFLSHTTHYRVCHSTKANFWLSIVNRSKNIMHEFKQIFEHLIY